MKKIRYLYGVKSIPRYDKLRTQQIMELLKNGATHFRIRSQNKQFQSAFNRYKALCDIKDHDKYRYEIEFPGGWFEVNYGKITLDFEDTGNPIYKRVMILSDKNNMRYENYILNDYEMLQFNKRRLYERILDDIIRSL